MRTLNTSARAELRQILRDFDTTFVSARRALLRMLPTGFTTRTHDLERGGDATSDIDTAIGQMYFNMAKKYNVYLVSEEHDPAYENRTLADYDWVLILDSLDGTVNMISGLTCGVNCAIGKPRNGAFRIRDVDAVVVRDYFTLKAHSWLRGSVPRTSVPMMHGGAVRKNLARVSRVYEVPDEDSYVRNDYPEGPAKQRDLLELFRRTFPSRRHQRRAIDCTGLRMLEVLDGNLLAYGDVRRVTRIWDTVPSMALLLAGRKFKVLHGDLAPVTGDEFILSQEGNDVRWHDDVGSEVVIVRPDDHAELRKQQLKTKRVQPGSGTKVGSGRKPEVFIVHGHDPSGIRRELADYLQNTLRLGKPTFLDDEPMRGMTLIEKFEDATCDTDIVIVLLTPDDEGKLKGPGKTEPRARENVIFELGYFFGKLGRRSGRVIILKQGAVNIPSDFTGQGLVDVSDGIKAAGERIRAELTPLSQPRRRRH